MNAWEQPDLQLDGQISFIDVLAPPQYKITKPIRLIELFAGIGSQAMAIKTLTDNYEHYRVVEFDKYAITSYNAIHGTNFPTVDITTINGDDLGIVDKEHFTYLLTYSFPCTDLSVAGKMQGMAEGSGTRSSLLWEVKRLLIESKEKPQILLMENVPQVHSKVNMPHFQKWLEFLENLGYNNFWQDLNAKNYGVAQSRNRTFVVSILGDYSYTFPKPFALDKTMKDYLEENVDEKYYVTSEKARSLIDSLIKGGKLADIKKYGNKKLDSTKLITLGNISVGGQRGVVYNANGLSPCQTATQYKDANKVLEINVIGQMDNSDGTYESANRIYGIDGMSPTIPTSSGGALHQRC